MSDRQESVTVVYQTETDMAVCVTEEEGGKDVWLPKALINWDRDIDYDRGDVLEITAPEWLLIRENLL